MKGIVEHLNEALLLERSNKCKFEETGLTLSKSNLNRSVADICQATGITDVKSVTAAVNAYVKSGDFDKVNVLFCTHPELQDKGTAGRVYAKMAIDNIVLMFQDANDPKWDQTWDNAEQTW